MQGRVGERRRPAGTWLRSRDGRRAASGVHMAAGRGQPASGAGRARGRRLGTSDAPVVRRISQRTRGRPAMTTRGHRLAATKRGVGDEHEAARFARADRASTTERLSYRAWATAAARHGSPTVPNRAVPKSWRAQSD